MNKKDIACYRVNYNQDEWKEYCSDIANGHIILGPIAAVNALCDEVERLQKIVSRRRKKS